MNTGLLVSIIIPVMIGMIAIFWFINNKKGDKK